MNTELYIARRISKDNSNKLSQSIIKINVLGIALGVAVMIISIAIVTGFKNTITEKVIGFSSHIQITNFDSNNSYETVPIDKNQPFLEELKNLRGITHSNIYALKHGVFKKGKDFKMVVFKGVGNDFNPSFFKENLVEGEVLNISDSTTSNNIVISKVVADMLKLKIGDPVGTYFIQEPPRMRKFIVSGIYETTLEQYDNSFALCDIKHIQKLNDWSSEQVSGFEVYTDDYKKIDYYTYKVFEIAGMSFRKDGSKLSVSNVKQNRQDIFDWLKLIDMNVWVILLIITLVAGFNLISGLLILIIDRTRMIGILKSIGTNNYSLKKVFIYQSLFLAVKGLVWGNLIGLGVCIIQSKYALIKLDQTAYFLNAVPINFPFFGFLAVNIATLVMILMMLLIPLSIISKLDPSRAIKFE